MNSIFLLATILLSLLIYPKASPTLGMVSLLFSLAFSIYIIFQKHKNSKHSRLKILQEVSLVAVTLILVLFLGGIAAMLANYQVSIMWGEVAGLVSAIGASFLVGYLVRKGLMRLSD